MKYAKILFLIAGIWGVLILTPTYFIFDMVGRRDPPPLTHPQFYYGFVSIALVWQFVFFVIATDPARFRPMIGLSILEKFSFVATVSALYLQGRIAPAESAVAVPDAILGVLFFIAFFKVRPSPDHP